MLKCTFITALIAAFAAGCQNSSGTRVVTPQIELPKVSAMPDVPQPYRLRDWKKTARDFDSFVFDFNKTGKHLPVIWIDDRPNSYPEETFAIPAYISSYLKENNHYDTITCLGAVGGASLIGIDKSAQNGRNWVAMCKNYFSRSNGQNLYLNNVPGTTGQTFWYEILPNILFYRIYHQYPLEPDLEDQFYSVADQWYKACEGMGGSARPFIVPDFNHTAYDFNNSRPVDNGIWKEAGSSAGIAWIEYMAYAVSGNEKYLTGAKWGMDYLEQIDFNPYYEMLLPQAMYLSARMNAELGCDYDTVRIMNWILEGDNWRKWGVNANRWGDYDCAGLSSSISDDFSYAFAMNTFNIAANIAPIPRYNKRLAAAVGKWMLNLTNSASLFYPDSLPPQMQSEYEWASKYDPQYCIAYEGLKQYKVLYTRPVQAVLKSGLIDSGQSDYAFKRGQFQVLKSGDNGLDYTWKIKNQDSFSRFVLINASMPECPKGARPVISYSNKPDSGFAKLFEIDSAGPKNYWKDLGVFKGHLYLKLTCKTAGCKIRIDDIYMRSKSKPGPYASGDPKDFNWGPETDMGLYGSSFVGFLAAVVDPTDVEAVLRIDCVKTDFFHDKAYPTYLYYNPYNEPKKITYQLPIQTADISKPLKYDIYETVSGSYLVREISRDTKITVPAKSSIVTVLIPSSVVLKKQGSKMLAGDVVINYSCD
jgi:hypothetical protein